MSNVVEAGDPSPRHNILKKPALVRSFELLATAGGGVAKLRELILMLAVRGKIEPQSHSEQSAQQLVSQIGAAKRQLLDSGRIRRDKPTPEVRDDDVLWAIPSNWVWVRLGDLGQIVGGGTPKSDDHAMWSPPTVPWLTPADLYRSTEKYVARGRRNISEVGLASSSAQLLPPSTVLFSSRAPIGYVAIAAEPLATNQGFKSCVPHLPSLAGYLYWFLKSAAKGIDAAASGTTFKEVSGGEFSKVLVPLPPLAEQHRIVARVEELMKLCDALEQSGRLADEQHARLTSTLFDALDATESAHALAENWQRVAEHFDLLLDRQEAIDAFEQSILRLALKGHLVRQKEGDEPANLMVERIQSSRTPRDRIRLQDQSEAMVGKPEHHEDLPPGWCSVRIGAIASVVTDGTHKTPTYASEGVMFVSAKDVRTGRLLFDACKYITPEEHELLSKRCRPERGDILVSKSGSIGTVVIVETDEDFSLFESLALIKFPQNEVLGSYLQLAIQQACNSLREGDIKGVAVKHLHLNVLRSLPIRLPPSPEQHRIVARVDELRLLSVSLQQRLENARQTQSHLAEALVAEVA